MISSSDEFATRPDAKPADKPAALRFWERRTNWYRIAEFEAALFCVLAGTWFLFFADLTDVSVGHSWMLRIGPEPAWIAALYLIGGLILLAALSRPGLIRGAGLMAGITFFSGVAVAAIHAHAMPVSTCALIAHTAALTVSFWRRYE